jgi:nitrous oxide reductase accessory protein NosL
MRFRNLPGVILVVLILVAIINPGPTPAITGDKPDVAHPIVTAHLYTKHSRCVNCGMKLNMWARTRHSFTLSDGQKHVCSIHCVAEIIRQKKETPQNVEVALYLEPETMIAAEDASYVVGSTAAGTMSDVSKIAFASQEDAYIFIAKYGGMVMTFSETLTKASEEN